MPNNGKLSVQPRFDNKTTEEVSSWLWTFWETYTGEDAIAEWGNPGRVDDLRQFARAEPILIGALSSMTSKAVSLDWQITGGRNRVTKYQELLAEADGGAGWSFFLDRWLQDYWMADQGGFVELGRQGKNGPVLGLYNLDAACCQLTAKPKTPVAYYPRMPGGAIGGRRIPLEPSDFTRIVDLPSADEAKGGLGFCATSRALKVAKVLMALYGYEEERLSDMPVPGIATITGMTQAEVKAAFDLYEAKRRAKEQVTFKGVLWLAAQASPINPIEVKLTSFAALPEGFDKRTTIELYVYTLALDFGVDVREFWPASQTGATKAEAEVQAQKAKGKGFGRMLSAVERSLNWDVLPEGLEFAFDQKDSEDDLLRETIREKTIANVVALAGAQLIAPDEARRWLVELQMAPEWLAETMLTTAHGMANTTDEDPDVVDEPELQPAPAETPVPVDQAVAAKAARAMLGPGEDFVAVNGAGDVVTLWSSRRVFAPRAKAASPAAAELIAVLAKRYNPNQPRHPAGTADGGQWAPADEAGASAPAEYISPGRDPSLPTIDTDGKVDRVLIDRLRGQLREFPPYALANLSTVAVFSTRGQMIDLGNGTYGRVAADWDVYSGTIRMFDMTPKAGFDGAIDGAMKNSFLAHEVGHSMYDGITKVSRTDNGELIPAEIYNERITTARSMKQAFDDAFRRYGDGITDYSKTWNNETETFAEMYKIFHAGAKPLDGMAYSAKRGEKQLRSYLSEKNQTGLADPFLDVLRYLEQRDGSRKRN